MDQVADVTQHYDLFSADAGARFIWRNHDQGIGLEPDAVTMRRAGQWTRVPFADIDLVTLSTAAIGQSRPIGQCTLTLQNGRRIAISNAPICAGVASPDMMTSNAASAWSSVRVSPAASRAIAGFRLADIGQAARAGALVPRTKARKLARMVWPCSLAMLSGWNCTPWIGSER